MSKSCLDPQRYVSRSSGEVTFFPCGRCSNCRDLNRVQMATRLLLESASHSEYGTYFLTLTYDCDHYPETFRKDHIDKFLQDLRNSTRDECTFRYVLVAEYGDLDARRHYHFLALTSVKFPDLGRIQLQDGYWARSNFFVARVRDSWPFGFVDDGGVPTPAAVLYTLGYALKEDAFSLEHEDDIRDLRWYAMHHREPPKELRNLKPHIPFRRFSLKPGIGLDAATVKWVYNYVRNDGVHYRFSIDLGDGLKVPLPGIYLRKIEDIDRTFVDICRYIRSHQFETKMQDELEANYARCSDGSLASSVRLARIKKRQDEKIQKALSQQLNIFKNGTF